MRTTVTLDDDVARLVDDTVQRYRRTKRDIINDAIRCHLGSGPDEPPYRFDAHHSDLVPGFDPGRPNELANGLSVTEFDAG